MNKVVFIIAFVLVSLTRVGSVWAQKYDYVKEKKVSESYVVQAGDKLIIDNSYGKVQINTSDRSEITVDITVTTKSNNEGRAQELLDDISFNIRNEIKTARKLSYSTVIKGRSNTNAEMQIDYVVNMPRKVLLEVYNKFGNVNIGELDALLLTDVSYGNLKTAAIKGANSRIKVSFGNAEIDFVDKAKLEFSYAKVKVERSNELWMKNMFSTIEINTVQKLEIAHRYGNLKMGTVKEISGYLEFADVDMDRFSDLTLDLKHCGKAHLGSMDADARNVSISASFSNIDFRIPGGASLSIEMMFRFGDLKSKPESISLNRIASEHEFNNIRYKGTVGKGEGRLRIDCTHGNVRLD